jgi:DNA-directed RNA polymerase specialized sigma24 family protein
VSKYKRKTNRLDNDFFEMSQQDIAKELNISQQAVQVAESRAMNKIKNIILEQIPEMAEIIRTGRFHE